VTGRLAAARARLVRAARWLARPLRADRATALRGLGAAALLAAVATSTLLLLRDGPTVALEAPPQRPPVLWSPAGEEVERLTPIVIAFRDPPPSQDAAALVQVEPAATGAFVWLDPQRLLFQPALPGLRRGGEYTLRISGAAAGLGEDVEHRYRVLGELTVLSAIPADGDTEVPLESQILVQFSRSVAPLTTLAEADPTSLISFSPPLAGRGEWLNTSLYRFVPADLAPSTRYEASIPAVVAATGDATLPQGYVWRFSTIGPALRSSDPADATRFVAPTRPVVLTFNQPMARAAAEQIVVRTEDGSPARTTAAWRDGDRSLQLTPAAPWQLDRTYRVELPAGLTSAAGTQTATARSVTFTTLGVPRITATEPRADTGAAQRYGIRLTFNQPVNLDSVFSRLTVSGLQLTRDQFYSFADRDGLGAAAAAETVTINTRLDPSTTYTVTLAAGAVDRAGLAIQPYTFRFTTGRLDPSLTLVAPNHYTTYSSVATPELYVRATNRTSATLELFRLQPGEARSFLDSSGPKDIATFTPSAAALRRWTVPLPPEENRVHLVRTKLTADDGPLPPGEYFVRLEGVRPSFGFSAIAFSVVDTALVTKLGVDELLVWALDYASGQPLAGVELTADGVGLAGSDRARTDAAGLATFAVRPANDPVFQNRERGWTVRLDGGGRRGVARTNWTQGLDAWSLGIPIEYYPRSYVGFVYLDRPIYRPGETVQIKGIVRRDDDASYSVADVPLRLTVYDSQGREVFAQTPQTGDFGSFALSFALPADAAVGAYRAQLVRPNDNRAGYLFAREFSVTEFRVPEFEVAVTTDRTDYIDGDTISAAVSARFFFGGALEGAPVRWTAFARPRPITYLDYPGYSFSTYDRYRQSIVRQPARAEGAAVTGSDGSAPFTVRAVLTGTEGPQQFDLSATVTDQNQQQTAASTAVTVHPSAVQVGLRPASYVATAGQTAAVRLVTMRVGGLKQPNQRVTLRVYERTWITTREETTGGGVLYRSEPRDTLQQTLDGATGADAEGRIEIVPRRAGTLYLVAEAADDRGRVHRAAAYLWVAGPERAAWRVTNDDLVELVADRESYRVGDTAEVLVQVPFPGATALVTVERGRVLERSLQRFEGSTALLRIPITERHVPNTFVSVVMYRPPGGDDPLPRYKVGYANLRVSTESRTLQVNVRPDRERAAPGERVRFDIEVRDHLGRPAETEVSLAVVDKAVLSLAEEVGPGGMRAFWFERGLGVRTGSSLAVSVERTNDVISELEAGGKGDGGDTLRREFRNTALWAPQLRTDAQGRASAEVVLPDNLTTWRAQARAIGRDARFGEGTAELLVTRPLIVRPALPRFLRVGDELQLRTLIRNGTTADFEVDVTLAAEGVEVTSPLQQRARVPTGGSTPVEWAARVTQPGSARLRITALRAGGLTDSVELERPIYFDDTLETTATGGVAGDAPRAEGIYLPEFALTHRGGLEVNVQSSLVGPLERELWRFAPPPVWPEREGAFSIASRIIATVGAYRSRPGAQPPDLSTDIARLIGQQRADGGFAYCSFCDSDPQVTAWVLVALADAAGAAGQRAAVPPLRRTQSYVQTYLDRPTDVERPADPNERAYLLYALLAALRADTDPNASVVSVEHRLRAVFEQDRGRLGNAGRAYLLLGLRAAGAGGRDPAIRALLNDITARVIPSANGNHWEDPPRSFAYHDPTRATALVLRALAAVDPEHPLIEETARWLSVATAGTPAWGISGAERIAAFGAYAARTQERAGAYDYDVRLDGEAVLSGRFDAGGDIQSARAALPLAQLGSGKLRQLVFARQGGRPGRLYYTLNLRYPVPATESEALNRGFAVSHENSLLDSPSQRIRAARLGDTVRVKVTVVTPADRQRVVLHDLLPAGLEPVDPTLRTTSAELRRRLDDERRAAAVARGPAWVAPWFSWYYSPWRAAELRDDRLTLYADRLPAGVHEYIYLARATTPGSFLVPPPVAEEAPFPEVFGRGDAERFTVLP
jgi:uncharacterized protein YfaS (alpha-2-macroglobulin family)